MSTNQAGFSIIEIIIAVSIFVIIASGAVISVIGSFSTTRLAKEELIALELAKQGIEASQSIANQDWDNLIVGTYGLSQNSNIWSLSGTSDLDPSGKYTRVITIEPVNRNISGDISATGNIDSNTYLISSNVSWNFTPLRQNDITVKKYLTNWQLATGNTTSTPPTATCADLCISLNYSSGTCRANTNQCNQNGETYQSSGDIYCTGGGSDTCCCAN